MHALTMLHNFASKLSAVTKNFGVTNFANISCIRKSLSGF